MPPRLIGIYYQDLMRAKVEDQIFQARCMGAEIPDPEWRREEGEGNHGDGYSSGFSPTSTPSRFTPASNSLTQSYEEYKAMQEEVEARNQAAGVKQSTMTILDPLKDFDALSGL